MLRASINRIIICNSSRAVGSSTKSTALASKVTTSEELAKERYDNRSNENVDTKRARLLYQSRKRGMLENGVILSSFANKYLTSLDEKELDQYDRLINLPTNDWDIYYWATKTKPTPPEYETPIMTKLREHIYCKVSNEKQEGDEDAEQEVMQMSEERYKPKKSYYGKTNTSLVILNKKHQINLEPDFSDISLVDYANELFDDGIIRKGGKYIARMTKYRREYFLRRLKRTISSPVSVMNLKDDDNRIIHGQMLADVDIGTKELEAKDLCDTTFDKNMKHHQFMQYMMSSKFTNDSLEYDDEAKAWAEMVWHRDYGQNDVKISTTSFEELCISCNEKLHCTEPGFAGYLPIELLSKLKLHKERNENYDPLCQRCRFSRVYSTSLSLDVTNEEFIYAMQQLSEKQNSVAILMVDLTDYPSGIWEGLINLLGRNYNQRIIVVGNKIDMIPYDGPGMIRRVTESLRKNISKLRISDDNLHLHDVIVVSAKTGFNVLGLVSKLAKFTEDNMNMYLIGTSNSGKSTLFNSLLQSDLSLAREGDLLSRVNPYEICIGPGNQKKMLQFPIKTFEGWETALRERKYERVERDYRRLEKSLLDRSRYRQATIPHQSMLINRLNYPALDAAPSLDTRRIPASDNKLVETTTADQINIYNNQVSSSMVDRIPNFTDDHPLKNVVRNNPLSADISANIDTGYSGHFYQTPSTSTPDQLHALLNLEEKLLVFPGTTIIPRKYSLRPLQTLFIGGLGRLDLLTATEFIIVTIFASKYLPIHVIDTRKADQFYTTFLGTPYLGVPIGRDQDGLREWPNLRSGKTDFHVRSNGWYTGHSDIVFSSLGWAMISLNPDQECLVRAFTPEARGISERKPCMVPYIRAQLKQKKIRDTPLFRSDTYKSSQISM